MDLLLILTYSAICIAIFKIFRIPLNKWTVPTAALGGIVLVGTLVFLMNYNHPHSYSAVRAFVSTPIIPNVKGLVSEVPITANTPLKEGSVLFRIDPTPFEAVVAQKQAALNLAKAQIKQMSELVEQAEAGVDKANSNRDRTLQAYERFQEVAKNGGVSEMALENRHQYYISAEASLESAEAVLSQRLLERDSQQTSVLEQRTAELARAEFDLVSTTVHAPSDGYVTHVRVRPGMMATSMPFKPLMTFISTAEADHVVVASFRQNAVQRLKKGYEAEIMFPSIPGRVFKAEVMGTLPAIGEGEMQASGSMATTRQLTAANHALVPVKVRIKDDISNYILPDGVFCEVAVYSDKMHHVAIMRKILLRMKSWQNFIYLDH